MTVIIVAILAIFAIGTALLTALMKGAHINPFPEDSNPIPPMPTPAPKKPATSLTAPQKLYQVAKDNLGKHLTMNSDIPFEVGCAQAMSKCLSLAKYNLPAKGISTVSGLVDWMKAAGFKEVSRGTPGCIIVGRSSQSAHILVYGNYGLMSNTSFTDASKGLVAGLWQENYSSVKNLKADYPQVSYFEPV